MTDSFERKIRGAAVAGWVTLLVGFAVLLVQWGAYHVMVRWRPEWAIPLLGPGITWEQLQSTWWLATVIFKGFLWALALVCLWLTLWSRQLRKTDAGSR